MSRAGVDEENRSPRRLRRNKSQRAGESKLVEPIVLTTRYGGETGGRSPWSSGSSGPKHCVKYARSLNKIGAPTRML